MLRNLGCCWQSFSHAHPLSGCWNRQDGSGVKGRALSQKRANLLASQHRILLIYLLFFNLETKPSSPSLPYLLFVLNPTLHPLLRGVRPPLGSQ